jgi:hypothetical protein
MSTLLLVLLVAVNFGLSWWNAMACGRNWVEARALGGWIKAVVWSAAIQSAIGFSSVLAILIAAIGGGTGFLDERALRLAMDFWYLLIIFPALATGLIVTIYSWQIAARERDLLSMGTAAYNTLAVAHNAYSAIDSVRTALSGVGTFFESDKEEGTNLFMLAVLITAVSLLGGVLLTATLIQRYAATIPLPERDELGMQHAR